MTINRYDKSNFPTGKRGWDQYIAEHHAESLAEAKTMTRAELEQQVADLAKTWLELLGYIDSLERGGAQIYKDRQEFFDSALESKNKVTELKDIPRSGGNAKVAKDSDGKQASKKRVYKRWIDYKSREKVTYTSRLGVEVKYKNKTDFARRNLSMEDALESQRVIEDWCADWAKEMDIPT